MVFSSTVFIFIFLPLTLAIYYNPIFRSRRFRNVFLFLASLAFYAWGEPIFVFLMLLSIVISWACGIALEKYNLIRKWLFLLTIIYHVTVLFIFKYFCFFVSEMGLLLNKNWNSFSIRLPIGISFFTFQLMSYLIDVYTHKAKAQKNILYVGLYISLFPQLIAGPIVRYQTIADQIECRRESWDHVVSGMKRFIYGLGKKVLIANYVAQIADNCFDFYVPMSVAGAWLGAVCYTLQIYFDFSGYSDMAIGLGEMFGFFFEENFNYPYISRNVTEFWRRWHISLSQWFRDYVYIPLGGNRVGIKRSYINLLIVWILTGIWHGANYTFIVWGLVYYVVLVTEKTIMGREVLSKSSSGNWVGSILSWVYTIIVVVLTWVVFRAESLSFALKYIGNMLGIGATSVVDNGFIVNVSGSASVICFAMLGATPTFKMICKWLDKWRVGWIESLFSLLVFVISLIQVVGSTYNPFIYFNF